MKITFGETDGECESIMFEHIARGKYTVRMKLSGRKGRRDYTVINTDHYGLEVCEHSDEGVLYAEEMISWLDIESVHIY